MRQGSHISAEHKIRQYERRMFHENTQEIVSSYVLGNYLAIKYIKCKAKKNPLIIINIDGLTIHSGLTR